MKKVILIALALCLCAHNAAAADLTAGNILISTEDVIYEVTPTGDIVQTIPGIRPDDTSSPSEILRDIAVGEDRVIHAYNGTLAPYMSTYDPITDSWSHTNHPGHSTADVALGGGLAVSGTRVFTTDQLTSGDAAFESGIVVFETDPNATFLPPIAPSSEPIVGQFSIRLAEGTEPIDLAVRHDGLLYVLIRDQFTSRMIIDIYDPQTLAGPSTIELSNYVFAQEFRAIAVGPAGIIYVATSNGELVQIDINSGSTNWNIYYCNGDFFDPCSFNDVDLLPDGQLALGTESGDVIIADDYLWEVARLSVSNSNAFVAVIPPSETSALDVWPERAANTLNISRVRNVIIALLTDNTVDASAVDPTTIRLGANDAQPTGRPRLRDTNGDQALDLRMRFSVADIGLQCGDTEISLSATTYEGRDIDAVGEIVIRGCD
ncbi:MAG: hypothetical protein AAFO81_14840 [Pseudomonadota bacterium]